MAISFTCHSCGKKLKAPDRAAGKTSTCPGCSSTVTCPEPVLDAEAIESRTSAVPDMILDDPDDLGDGKPYGLGDEEEAQPLPRGELRRPCPMCGELIPAGAAKCRFCGEVFDEDLKKAGIKKKKKKKKSRSSDPEDDNLSPLDSIVVIVSFVGLFIKYGIVAIGIGLIMSIVYMIQGKKKGIKMFAVLLVVFLIAILVATIFVFNQMRKGQPVIVD